MHRHILLLLQVPQPTAAPSPPVQLVGNTKLFVGNIDMSITADMIKQIFAPFGTVLDCQLVPDPDGSGKVSMLLRSTLIDVRSVWKR